MTMLNSQEHNKQQQDSKGTAADTAVQLSQGEGSADQFLLAMVATQCSLTDAEAGAVIYVSPNGQARIGALHPKPENTQTAPQWLRHSLRFHREAISASSPIIKPIQELGDLYGQQSHEHLLMASFNSTAAGHCLAVFLLPTADRTALEASRERLRSSFRLLSLAETLSAQRTSETTTTRLSQTIRALAAVNTESTFRGAAMAFCNELTSRMKCERVSIGFVKGRYVKLLAMSHTENFHRKMELVQAIESAMEECCDQDIEVLFPASRGATYVNRAAENLSKRHGPSNVLTLPLRRADALKAVVTLERPHDKEFGEEVETIRLACELCTPRLVDLYEARTWFTSIVVEKGRGLFSGFLEPRHTAAKVAAIAVFFGLLFLIFGKGTFKADAPFVLEATYQQVVPAPFDGYIKTVEVEVGDQVEADKTVLGSLDTAELRLQLAQAKAEQAAYLKQAAAAMRDGETAQAQIAQASADKAGAQIDLLNYHIERADLKSPITGSVVKGDLKRQIGAPVKTGDLLFEVTPLESLRAELMVPEDKVFEIRVGQKGYLATFSYPAQHIEFEVERVNPVAEVINQRNIFRVRVRLLETHSWMRSGMEGVAKVHVGKRPYIWIWTRKVVNWIRMKLWI